MDNDTVTRRNRHHLQAAPETADPVEKQQHAAPVPQQQDCSSPTTMVAVPQEPSQSLPLSGPTLRSPAWSTAPWR